MSRCCLAPSGACCFARGVVRPPASAPPAGRAVFSIRLPPPAAAGFASTSRSASASASSLATSSAGSTPPAAELLPASPGMDRRRAALALGLLGLATFLPAASAQAVIEGQSFSLTPYLLARKQASNLSFYLPPVRLVKSGLAKALMLLGAGDKAAVLALILEAVDTCGLAGPGSLESFNFVDTCALRILAKNVPARAREFVEGGPAQERAMAEALTAIGALVGQVTTIRIICLQAAAT